MATTPTNSAEPRWYQGVTGYQWLVLAIASAGWVFDAFEGQLFNITRTDMLADVLHVASGHPDIRKYGDAFLAIFLVGGTLGGVLFGSLADKWGRRPTMAATILMYSIFSGLTYFATEIWQVGVLRFLVAMGVGGEWAVAAALVAEVFPPHARAHASGFFHATSVIGTWLAALAGMAVGAHWRNAYLIGIIPALLVLWVRSSVHEPEKWAEAKAKEASGQGGVRAGSYLELFGNPQWRSRAIMGMFLAAVGLATFWSVTVAGQDLARDFLLRQGVAKEQANHDSQWAYGWLQATGAGFGLLSFGPLAVWLGRKRAFVLMHILGFAIVPITCFLPATYTQLLILLPVYGFMTISIHAGYAVYFPELFPTHLRATGSGFCFNGGRFLAAPMLVFSGWLKSSPKFALGESITLMACLYFLGLIVLLFLPETKGKPLPE